MINRKEEGKSCDKGPQAGHFQPCDILPVNPTELKRHLTFIVFMCYFGPYIYVKETYSSTSFIL